MKIMSHQMDNINKEIEHIFFLKESGLGVVAQRTALAYAKPRSLTPQKQMNT
jgi:hypothetical protein